MRSRRSSAATPLGCSGSPSARATTKLFDWMDRIDGIHSFIPSILSILPQRAFPRTEAGAHCGAASLHTLVTASEALVRRARREGSDTMTQPSSPQHLSESGHRPLAAVVSRRRLLQLGLTAALGLTASGLV